jgi:hypothetical protein
LGISDAESALQVVLPLCILALSFILKLVVDRTAKIPDLIDALFELPIDIAVLATTLIAATAMTKSSHASDGLIDFAFYIVGTIITVVTWRRSVSLFENYKYRLAILVSVFGYIICIYGLYHAIEIVSRWAK